MPKILATQKNNELEFSDAILESLLPIIYITTAYLEVGKLTQLQNKLVSNSMLKLPVELG